MKTSEDNLDGNQLWSDENEWISVVHMIVDLWKSMLLYMMYCKSAHWIRGSVLARKVPYSPVAAMDKVSSYRYILGVIMYSQRLGSRSKIWPVEYRKLC